jgi:hypothetical protein
MSDASNALQVAIYNRLTNELSVPVYDHVPQADDAGADAAFPYVTIGEDSLEQYDTDTSDGFNGTVVIHVWSRHRGRKEVKSIQGEIYDALHRHNLQVAGYHTILCYYLNSTSFMDVDGLTRHGVSQFRVLLERDI